MFSIAYGLRRVFLCPQISVTAALLLGSTCLATAIPVSAAPPANRTDRADSTRSEAQASSASSGFGWTVRTPELTFSGSDATAGEEFTFLSLEGFASAVRSPGHPDLPRRVYRVAIPFEATATLHYEVRGKSSFPGVVPRPAPGWVAGYEDSRSESEDRSEIVARQARHFADSTIYEAKHPFPAEPVRLGEYGVLRNQRYVEVVVEPICFFPDRGSIEKLDEIRIELKFEGGELSEEVASDSFFEAVYAGAFVNSDQSRLFRREPAPERVAAGAQRAPDGQTGFRIRIDQDGLQRIDFGTLDSYGLAAAPISTLRLQGHGVAIPLIEEGNGDDQLTPGEFLLFYGERLDDEPRSKLNYDIPGSALDIYEAGDFSDDNVYFLEGTGQTQPGFQTLDGTPTFSRVPPPHFEANIRAEVDDAYRPLGGADPWYWLPTMSFNFNSPERIDSLTLTGLADGSLPASFQTKVRGVSDDVDTAPDHGVQVAVRNDQAALVGVTSIEFEGRNVATLSLVTGGGAPLTETIEIQTEVLTGLWNRNDVILDYYDVTYRRSFSAVGGALEFDWPDEDAEFIVTDLPTPAARAFELVADPGTGVRMLRPISGLSISGPGPASVRFRIDDDPLLPPGSVRRFLVADDSVGSIVPLADTRIRMPSDLRDSGQQADMIVIGHPDVLDLGPGRPADLWLQHRQSPAGGGLTVKVAMLEEVENEFNHGLAGPTAIRNFLQWVMSDEPGEGWADPKPAFVLLVGDASFDYKGGLAKGIYIPTQMMFYDQLELGYHASDSDLAAVLGDDGIPDLIVGRIPARTQSQADLVFEKTVSYETASASGDWRSSVLTISDRGKFLSDGVTPNPNESDEFEVVNDSAISMLDGEPYGVRHLRYLSQYYNLFSNPWNLMRNDIKAAVNGTDGAADGRAVVQFIGHGNFQVWSDDAFWDERPPISLQDSMDFSNNDRLSLMLAQNCLSGGFHACPSGDCGVDTYNLAEQWLLSPDGGAVATFSPTGLSFTYVGREASDRFWSFLFGPSQERMLAPAVLSAYVGLCAENRRACQYYSLLGDPAVRLQLPTVAAPGAPDAVGANMSVDLSWAASSTPGATYDVFRRRADFAAFDYVKANGSPITGTAFTDVNLTNAIPYEYFVIARDPQGFRSAQSNFNVDCPGAGDCSRATPLNPIAPDVPTPLGLDDPGLGDSLRFEWMPSPEVDVDRYTVYWGESPGNLTSSQVLPVGTESLLVRGLSTGVPYYFAVAASNSSGLSSSLSAPLSDFPVFAPGVRPPSYISDLTLERSGSDVVLQWSEVTEDSYGKPLQPVLYEILRGAEPNYSNSNSSVLGTCAAPCTSWTHVNGINHSLSLHYRVRAVDAAGLGGALGSPYPDGTQLQVSNSGDTPGDLTLSWGLVSETLEGGLPPSIVYEVYRSSAPITRQAVEAGSLTPVGVVETTTLEVTPFGGTEYYSVFVVDSRGNRSPY